MEIEFSENNDFLAELYGDESEGELLDDELIEPVEASSDEEEIIPELRFSSPLCSSPHLCSSPEAPPYSPLTPPGRRESDGQRSRSRSRSPITIAAPDTLSSSDVVIRLYNEWEMDPLADAIGPEAEFVSPDAHVLFERADAERVQSIQVLDASEWSVFAETGAEVDRDVRARSIRGRVRGAQQACVGRRGRAGPGRGGGRRKRGEPSWEVSHPLEEIWVTDDDVPLELREMAKDVMRKRQERAKASAKRRKDIRNVSTLEGDDSASEVEDEVFYDAADGRDVTILEENDRHFQWLPMESFCIKEETFDSRHTGSVKSYKNAYTAFRTFWDDKIIQYIVDVTNTQATKINSAAFQSSWYPTNSDEMLCLFAFWMMTGIIRMPTICSYFSTNALLKTEIFSRITTLKRYNNLNRALHFVDTEPIPEVADPTNSGFTNYDRLHYLRPVINHLNSNFQSKYVPSKDICIDESLILWKGRLRFRQYIRSKAAKFGIKTFELCESATGYLWSFLVYTGKHNYRDLESNISKSAAVVLKLIKPLLNKGHRLFMDNWYNSPVLARYLKRNKTDCVGTLRPTRHNVPKLLTTAPLKQGQYIARHSGDMCILSWMDKKRVTMISTCHGSAAGLSTVPSHPPGRPLAFKPQVVLDYNRSMGGVDLKDQMLEPYLLERKRCAKWYIKLFKRLLNCSIHNARVLLESSSKTRQDNLKFRLELVLGILTHHHHHIPLGRRANAFVNRTAPFSYILHHNHWPVRILPTAYEARQNRQGRQRCTVCWTDERKLSRTGFKCEECDVALCIENCFKKYHSVPH